MTKPHSPQDHGASADADRAGRSSTGAVPSPPSGDHPIARFDPAPWSIEDNPDDGSAPSLMITTRDAVVAEVYADLVASEPVCQANARLIAAAPELYEACGDALELLNEPVITPAALNAVGKRLEAALAKARGQQ